MSKGKGKAALRGRGKDSGADQAEMERLAAAWDRVEPVFKALFVRLAAWVQEKEREQEGGR